MVPHGEVLIATADLATCRGLASILSQWGLEPICAATVEKAKAILARQAVVMVFCQDRLADGSFRDVLGAAKLLKSKVRVVVTSRTGSREAVQLGALDVIPYPCRPADVHRVVFHAMRDDAEKPHGPAFCDAQEKSKSFASVGRRPYSGFAIFWLPRILQENERAKPS